MPSINLRLKFITGLVVFILALGVCVSLIMYFHINSIMESEISQRSHMILAQSDAVQDYIKTQLRPEMFAILPEGRFVLKAMSSSYISREVMARLNLRDASHYHYRRVAVNARNPDSEPDAFESGLIRFFKENPNVRFWEDTTMINEKQYRLVGRPVTFGESCMNCHGLPENAPGELIDIYGDKNGFYRAVNEVGGVVVAGFPVAMIKNPAKELTLQYLTLYLLGIFLFFGLISLFFDRLVMKNLQNLTQIFKTRFSGETEQRIIRKLAQKDEIEGLIEGVDELAVCLSDARRKLEDHTRNLEKTVENRTRELDKKARKHLGDVRLFVDLLTGFGGAQTVRQLLSALLKSVGIRYQAEDVVYYCLVASENYYAWKSGSHEPDLSPEVRNLIWKNDILFQDHKLFIPVKSPESHWGILCLIWENDPDPGDLDPEVLLALGQQVAVLIENIHVFSGIRSQHDMLQSVFEGISDPLLLIDEECHIIITNRAGHEILGPGGKEEQQEALRTWLCTDVPNTHECSLLSKVSCTGRPVKEEIHTPDDRYFDIDLYPLPRRDQAQMQIVVYARNITQEKEMGERMRQAEHLGAIGKLAAGVAHEINNPLGVIQCYTDLVRDAVTDQEVVSDIDIIAKHTKAAQKVVQDLLALSRPKKNISGTSDLNQVVIRALDVFKAQAVSRNIHIVTRLSDNLPRVTCDSAILEQILTNLWLNAVDALQESGDTIFIETLAGKNHEVLLRVADNGPGIPDIIRHRIFDPFYTTKEVGKGTGLGLSIVYGFVTELNGRITVDTGDQTRFDIFLPTVPENPVISAPSDRRHV
jgi:signal transduction histidine kinase/preprotein translocase subunit Sec61beta